MANGEQLHALLAGVVLAGQLYLAGATVPQDQWPTAKGDVETAVSSFRLVKQLR